MKDINARPRLLHFSVFEVDLRTGELRKQGLKVKLHGQPFQVLALLLERPGELVSREEIRAKLWPGDTFIDFEHSVNSSIKRLREALGDDPATPRFIETLPRHGYRFIAPVECGAVQELPLPTTGTEAMQESPLRRDWVVAATGALVVAMVAVLFALNVAGLRSRVLRAVGLVREPPLEIQSIAVLPFDNLSNDPEQEYFADGMTEELITNLGKIGALRVISRTSVMQYRGTRKPLPQIGRELKVDAIVEGTVRRSGNRMRITANLLEAPTDRHLWAESYERDQRDALTLQGEVAQAIAREIQIKVTPREQALLASARPVNPEAYRLCQLGRFQWNKRTEEGFKSAIEYFQRAVEVDPGYAPAYAGLADSIILLSDWGYMPAREVVPRGKAAALKAVEIDPLLAEAHTSLALACYEYDWDWPACTKEFQRAIELNPNYATARQWYGEYLARMRRFNEAIAENEKAQQLDPLSPQIGLSVALRFIDARRYDEAISQVEKALPLFPDYPIAYWYLGGAYEAKGSYEKAVAAWEEARLLTGAGPVTARLQAAAALKQAYAKGGIRGYYLGALEGLKEDAKSRYVRSYEFAQYYARLGERTQAMACLERAYQERDFPMTSLQIDWAFDALRSDSRFQNLLHRMNFPP